MKRAAKPEGDGNLEIRFLTLERSRRSSLRFPMTSSARLKGRST